MQPFVAIDRRVTQQPVSARYLAHVRTRPTVPTTLVNGEK